MLVSRRRRRRSRRQVRMSLATVTAFAFLLFASSSTSAVSVEQLSKGLSFEREEEMRLHNGYRSEPVVVRRRLSGLGSSPPTCRSKCGRCRPCKPVHVPIQPGLSFPLEYYPEAWRCKCGNKLFMP